MFKFMHSILKSKGNIKNYTSSCVYCGKCEKICPANAIKVNPNERTWVIDNEVCVRCKRCVRTCPKQSLSLVKN